MTSASMSSFQPDDASRVVELKLAISYVSIAKRSCQSRTGSRQANFDQVLTEAVAQWEEKLGRIRVFGGHRSTTEDLPDGALSRVADADNLSRRQWRVSGV